MIIAGICSKIIIALSKQFSVVYNDRYSYNEQLVRANNHHAKTYKLRITGSFCKGNPPGSGGFPSQRASHSESVSMPCFLPPVGVQVKQLARQNEAMPEMPAWAGKMAKNPTLAAMSSALKDEGLIDNAPEPPAAMGGCMGMPMACPPMMMSCPPPPPPGGMASMPITLETIPPPSSPAMM